MFSFFENLVSPFTESNGAVQTDSVFTFIGKQIIGLKKYMLLVALFSMCTAAIEVYLFKFLGNLVDGLNNTDSFFSANMATLVQIGLVLLVVLPIVASAHTLLWQQTLAGNFPLRILSSTHQHLLNQSVDFYQVEAAGKVANTLFQTTESAKLVVLKSIDTFMFAIVFFLSTGLMLSNIDLHLLSPVIAWFVGYIFVILYFVPKLKHWSNRQACAKSEVVGQLVDTYTNIATVKLFSHSSIEKSYAQGYLSKYLDTIKGQMRFISKVQFLMWGLNIALIFSTITLSLSLWSKELISAGAIAAAVGVSFRIYTMSHWIMWEISGMFGNWGVIQDGIKLLCKSLPKSAIEGGEPLAVEKYDISFTEVDFSYNNNEKIINQFSLEVHAGEKIGIIGRSGSGKSTLAKLLLRFHEVDSGRITIGGMNIQNICQESLMEKIAVVAQDVELLDRTIRENLAYGKANVSEEEMINATKAAGAHNFILDFIDERGCKGYDARVGVRGAKLSGGQRQRISLARALIKNSPILIFDEATSALDSEIESHILNHMSEYMSNKTIIMIAHRLTTLARMDRLAIIEQGKVVEIGSHEDLKANRGLYFHMLNTQFEKVLDNVALPV